MRFASAGIIQARATGDPGFGRQRHEGPASREEIIMEIGKVRELGPAELREEARKASEQLFRIRFNMKLGQTEGVKRLRALRKDVARIKTIENERALGIRGAGSAAGASPAAGKTREAKADAGEVS